VCCVVLYPYLLNTLSPMGMFVGVNAGLLGKAREKLLLQAVSVSCEVIWKSRCSLDVPVSEFVITRRTSSMWRRGVYSSFAASLST